MDKEMLYTLLAAMADMKDSMNNGFAELNEGLRKLEKRIENIENKMESFEDKADNLDDKLEAVALDVEIIKATVKKQDYEINRLRSAI